MQDVYDFFSDINSYLIGKGLERLDDMLRAANMSGLLSDMLTASLAKHSRTLVRADEFRRNERGDLGTRTSTLNADGIARLRTNWVYLDQVPSTRNAAKRGNASRAKAK